MRANRISYGIGAVLIAAAMVLVGSTPALAAVPANDTFGNAAPIAAIPFTTTLDTSDATTDADDTDANTTCGAPALDASVWYSFTSTVDGALLVDLAASDYPAGVLVVTGAPGSFQIVRCGPTRVAFPVSTGVTYYLLVIDDQSDGGGNGGNLVMTVDVAPPPPTMAVTVDPTGDFHPQNGGATVHGTITCTGLVQFAFVDVQLRQQVGRGAVNGFGTMDVRCDGSTQPWAVDITPETGTKFSGGKAASLTFAVACGPVFCTTSFQEYPVRLKGKG